MQHIITAESYAVITNLDILLLKNFGYGMIWNYWYNSLYKETSKEFVF